MNCGSDSFGIILISFIVECVAIMTAVFAAGASHGTYIPATTFLPFTTLSTVFHGTITNGCLLFGLIQSPVHEATLLIGIKFNKTKPIVSLLIALHSIAVFVVLAEGAESYIR